MNLPSHYCSQDERWIKERINMLAPTLRNRAVRRYGEVYNETYTNTPICYQKEGEARKEANTRLRLFVDRYGMLDKIKNPPLSEK